MLVHGLNHTICADDTQVYILFDPCHRDSQIDLLGDCIKDIKAWAVQNKITFNDAKTEILHSRFITSNSNTLSQVILPQHSQLVTP